MMKSGISKQRKSRQTQQNEKKAERLIYAIICGLILLALITAAFYAVSI